MTYLTKFYAQLASVLKNSSASLQEQTHDSGILGQDRELFVQTVLARSLPKTVLVESGIVIGVNSAGQHIESNPQDLILYKSNFPVLSGLIGARHFLNEGVIAKIEIKSSLDQKEFHRALATLNSGNASSNFTMNYFSTPELSEKGKKRVQKTIFEDPFSKNQLLARRYLFAYRGVKHETITGYIHELLKEGVPFWNLPSAICILDSGICMIRDDGQLLPAYFACGKKFKPDVQDVLDFSLDVEDGQCVYQSLKYKDRALEFFMLHILSTCFLSSGELEVFGTPFSLDLDTLLSYMDDFTLADFRPLVLDQMEDLTNIKIRKATTGRFRNFTTDDSVQKEMREMKDDKKFWK